MKISFYTPESGVIDLLPNITIFLKDKQLNDNLSVCFGWLGFSVLIERK